MTRSSEQNSRLRKRNAQHISRDGPIDSSTAKASTSKDKDVSEQRKDKASTRPAKRVKTDHVQDSTRRVRGKRGVLEKLAKDTPMDVVLEIFKYLLPLDILNLARTSKDLRAILMTRSSLPIWRAARKNVPGLPPISSDLSEAQYASLAFESRCHICMRGPCNNIIWKCRIRCHKTCYDKALYTKEGLSQLRNWTSDIDNMIEILGNVPQHNHRFKPSFIKALRIEYMEVKGQDSKKFLVWRKRKRNLFRNIAFHSFQCEIWYNSWVKKCLAEQDDSRRERLREITRRLTALGWEAKDLEGELEYHHLVDNAKPLTDRSWNSIKPILLEFLEERKAHRLKLERQMIHTSRYRLVQRVFDMHRQKNRGIILPPIGDFIFASDGINKLICSDLDREVPESEFSKTLCAEMPRIAEDWIQKKEKELLRLLPKNSLPVFKCTECGEVLWIPRVFVHSCCTDPRVNPVPDVGKIGEAEVDPFVDFSWRLWSSKYLGYDPRAAEYAKAMFELSGARDLDELELLDPLFECLDCGNGTEGRLFLRWTKVIYHPVPSHTFSVTSFDNNLRRRILKLHADHPRSPEGPEFILCRICNHTPEFSIRDHLMKKHDIQPPDIQPKHWRWTADTLWKDLHPPPVRLVDGTLS